MYINNDIEWEDFELIKEGWQCMSLEWENQVGSTRYGQYAAAIEQRALVRAHECVQEPTTALDIGCEGGRWAQLLAQRGWKLMCTDTNKKALAICQERLPVAQCLLVRPDDTRLPCPSTSISLISCIQVFPVIHSTWFMDEAVRVLAPGGVLIGTFLNRASWRGFLYHHVPTLRVKGSGAWYWYPETYTSWRKRLQAHGFTILHEEGYGWSPFRRNSNAHIIPLVTSIENAVQLKRVVRFSPIVVFIARKV